MRSLALLGLVVVLLAATALSSPWVAWGVEALLDRPFTFKRVYNRVFEVLLVLALLLGWRRLDLGSPSSLGLARRTWGRELARGLGIGLVGVGVALGLSAIAGAVVPDLRYPLPKTGWKALLGMGAAVAVGVGEEVLFRGVILRRLTSDAGRLVGVAATTLIYAAVHALRGGGGRGPASLWAGLERTRTLLAPLAEGPTPELIGLVLLGLVLATARLRTGSLWVAIGIHGAWVAVFRVGRLFFHLRPVPGWLVGAGWPPLIGGVAAWAGIAVMVTILLRRPRKAWFSFV